MLKKRSLLPKNDTLEENVYIKITVYFVRMCCVISLYKIMKVERFREFSIKHFNSADEAPEGFELYFYHLSSQTGADPLAVL